MIDAKDIELIAKSCRDNGVSFLKTDSLEIHFGQVQLPEKHSKLVDKQSYIAPQAKNTANQGEDKEIKHKVEEFKSIMKLSDSELVDQLFPDHVDQGEDE